VIAFPRSAETSRANGSRWGGVRSYWRDEGEQATATKATFGRLQLGEMPQVGSPEVIPEPIFITPIGRFAEPLPY